MRRREFITLIASVAVFPLSVHAQQTMPVIGMLNSGPVQPRRDQIEGFLRGLKDTGFVEGQNVSILKRGADDHYDRLPALAAELVHQRADVIMAVGGPPAALAAKAATSATPIVFAAVSDPVKSGLVASLNRPGGNFTGNAGLSIELDPKRLEILTEVAPDAMHIGLINPQRPGVEVQEQQLRDAAKLAGRELVILRPGNADEIDVAFAAFAEKKIAALLVGADALFNNHRRQIIILAAQAGLYVGRILNGEKPADLPVVQPSKFELVINLKTARAIGLTIPAALIARADEIIE
jgi:putative ABC transport system substrate-binding protein